jgi:transcriptional regulator GlxA family with amidase domain
VNIAYLAARFRLSKPTLERLFLEVVGLPPKLYARMLRFKKAMQLLQQVNTPQWQPATAGAQYYNEAVLKQDYVYFNGQAPSFFSTLGTGNNNTAAVAQMPVHNTGIAVA